MNKNGILIYKTTLYQQKWFISHIGQNKLLVCTILFCKKSLALSACSRAESAWFRRGEGGYGGVRMQWRAGTRRIMLRVGVSESFKISKTIW